MTEMVSLRMTADEIALADKLTRELQLKSRAEMLRHSMLAAARAKGIATRAVEKAEKARGKVRPRRNVKLSPLVRLARQSTGQDKGRG